MPREDVAEEEKVEIKDPKGGLESAINGCNQEHAPEVTSQGGVYIRISQRIEELAKAKVSLKEKEKTAVAARAEIRKVKAKTAVAVKEEMKDTKVVKVRERTISS